MSNVPQKRLFQIEPNEFGEGKVHFEWSPRGELLATAGTKVRHAAVSGLN